IEKRDFILGQDKNNTSGLFLKASILFKQNDVDEAIKIAQDIFSRKPGYIQNSVFLSALYLRGEKYESSINVLKACIKENPEDSSLVNRLANAYLAAGKHNLAENEYKNILKKNPEIFSNYLKLALFYKKIGNVEKAENILRESIKNDVNDVNRKAALIDIIKQTKGYQSAIDELKRIINENQEMGELRLRLAKLYLEEKNHSEAIKALEGAVSDFSEGSVGVESRVHLANLYMQKENIEAATSLIHSALEISPNDAEVNFIYAKIQLLNEDYEEAVISLRTVVKDNPEKIEAYFLLSAAHKGNGENEQARDIIYRAYDNNRTNINGLISLAKYHARNKNTAELEKIIDSCLSIDENNYEALSFKSTLLNERKMFSDAKIYAVRMVELYPDMPDGYIQYVPYLLAEKSEKEAIALLEEGYKKVRDKGLLFEPLVSLYASLNNFTKAISKVESAIQEDGATADLYTLLAKIHIASGNITDAKVNLAKAGVKSDLEMSFRVAQIYVGLKDYKSAINEYEKAYKKYSNSTILINNLVSLLSEHGDNENDLNRAIELVDKIKNIDQAVVLDTVAWTYYKAGNYSEAAEILKTVVEKSPYEDIFNYHYGMALYKTGDLNAAKIYLARSLEKNNGFSGKDDAEAVLQKLQ
ncbi:MAG: tetratricopeptide repeat protein, partial [Gammaproteobacteria bacterium]|nr:tetratricopeptide repeat protein [Gammaproteobacteria bacterium]